MNFINLRCPLSIINLIDLMRINNLDYLIGLITIFSSIGVVFKSKFKKIFNYGYKFFYQTMCQCLLIFKYLFVVVILVNSQVAFSNEQNTKNIDYEHKKGWFFYNEIVEPDFEELPPIEADEIIDEENTPKPNLTKKDTKESNDLDIKFFSTAWFKKNLQYYKEKAIDEPTYENVKAFLYLQKIILDKSNNFSDMVQLVTLGNPYLDSVSNRPTATFGSNVVDRESSIKKQLLLDQIHHKAGLLYIFSGNSPYHLSFAPLLNSFAQIYNLSVKAVSVDEPDLGGTFVDVTINQNAAKAFGVEQLPAIFLISLEHKITPVLQGITSIEDLGKRMLIAARRIGVVSEDEFLSTKPIINSQSLMQDKISKYIERKFGQIQETNNHHKSNLNNSEFNNAKELNFNNHLSAKEIINIFENEESEDIDENFKNVKNKTN